MVVDSVSQSFDFWSLTHLARPRRFIVCIVHRGDDEASPSNSQAMPDSLIANLSATSASFCKKPRFLISQEVAENAEEENEAK